MYHIFLSPTVIDICFRSQISTLSQMPLFLCKHKHFPTPAPPQYFPFSIAKSSPVPVI